MKPIFAIGLPHGDEWIMIAVLAFIMFGFFIWAVARRK
jgi:hypothetical protein